MSHDQETTTAPLRSIEIVVAASDGSFKVFVPSQHSGHLIPLMGRQPDWEAVGHYVCDKRYFAGRWQAASYKGSKPVETRVVGVSCDDEGYPPHRATMLYAAELAAQMAGITIPNLDRDANGKMRCPYCSRQYVLTGALHTHLWKVHQCEGSRWVVLSDEFRKRNGENLKQWRQLTEGGGQP